MYCEVARLALIGRTEPDIIARNEATLQWKMHPELVLFDTRLNLVDDGYGVFRRDVIFHLLETNHARRRKQARTVIHLINVGDGTCRYRTDALNKAGKAPAPFVEESIYPVFHHDVVEITP